MTWLQRLKLWLSSWRQTNAIKHQKRQRYLQYDVADPTEQCVGHSRVWTAADGIWYCEDCREWYRTWEDEPQRPTRQKLGY